MDGVVSGVKVTSLFHLHAVVVPPDLQCKNRECQRRRRKTDDGEGYYDYCGMMWRDMDQMALKPSGNIHGCVTLCQQLCNFMS